MYLVLMTVKQPRLKNSETVALKLVHIKKF